MEFFKMTWGHSFHNLKHAKWTKGRFHVVYAFLNSAKLYADISVQMQLVICCDVRLKTGRNGISYVAR